MTVASISSSLEGATRKIEDLLEKAKISSEANFGNIKNQKMKVLFVNNKCLEQFLNCGLGSKLGPAIGVFAGLLKDLDTSNLSHSSKLIFYKLLAEIKVFVWHVWVYDTIADSWEGLEEILKDHFKHVTVQDAFENLMTTERNWNSFLNELDQNLQHGKPKVKQCSKDISHDTQLS